MDLSDLKEDVKNLDRRLERVEQILPTLATKEDLRPLATRAEVHIALGNAIAPLATKEELEAAIRPLATKAELREEGERTRRHFDVIAESLHDKITLIAEGHAALSASLDTFRQETRAGLAHHDLRITRLEAKRPRR